MNIVLRRDRTLKNAFFRRYGSKVGYFTILTCFRLKTHKFSDYVSISGYGMMIYTDSDKTRHEAP